MAVTKKIVSVLLSLMVLVSIFAVGSVSVEAASYTECASGTVSWQMIYDNPNTYYWIDGDGYYCALTATKSGSKYYVTLYRPGKSNGTELRYLRQDKSDDSASEHEWDSASAKYTGGKLYKSGSSSSTTYYTVTWKNYDNTYTYYSESVASGTIPAFDKTQYSKGTLPERGTGYTFIGWSTSTYADTAMTLPAVTKNVTYYAAFSQASVSNSVDYVLVDAPTTGRKYIISNEDSNGTGYVLTGTGGTTTMTTKPSDSKYNTPYITATNENNVFTFTGSASSFTLTNSSDSYLRFSAKETAPTTTGSGTTTFVYSSKTLYSNSYAVELKNNTYRFRKKTGTGGETVYFFEQVATPTTVDFTGNVVWNDGSDTCKKRPSNIRVYLYKDGTYANKYKDITGTSDTWTASWTGLEQGTYTISVTAPDGYTASYSNSNKTVTLSRATTRTFTTNVVWNDDNNAYDTRENYVNIKLISSDTSIQANKQQLIGYKDDGVTVRNNVTINGNTWSYLESSLPNIDYSIGTYTDTPATGYDYTISGNTITFTIKKYTVTWKNGDTALETDTNVLYGSTPVYNGTEPTKTDDTQYTYTFIGWKNLDSGQTYTGTLPVVTDNVTYTAVFASTARKYTITWKNYDGTTLETDTNVENGTQPAYNGATPTKTGNAQYSYTFNGWATSANQTSGTLESNLPTVTANVTYYAAFQTVTNTYTVTWKNDDGTVLETDENVPYGTTPSYDGAAPTKDATAENTYTFKDWDKTLVSVTGDVTYTAQFDSAAREYTITWKNDDGSVIDTTTVPYGTTPTHDNPTKDATAQYTYTFTGWSPAVTSVTGDATYTATYSSTVNQYTITWKNDDGSVIDTTTVPYGTTPTHDNPTKDATAQYTYTFAGWSPEIKAVTANTTYTATYSSAVRSYTITWVDGNGKTLKTDTVAYGETPSYTGDTPAKTATAQYSYEFNHQWSPAVTAVDSDVAYTAQFDSTVRSYTITWKDNNGTTIGTTTVNYGEMPSHTAPTKPATAEYTYTFANWTPTLQTVTGEATYTASYTATKNQYTVKFVDEDGTELSSAQYDYGTAAADIVHPDAPTKAADAQYTYTFAGWNPAVAEVTGNATYTAVYTSTVNTYTVTWKNDDGTVLATDTNAAYGTTPTYSGTTPTKSATAQYTYTFDKWSPVVSKVTGNAEYTATYTSTVNKYMVTWTNADGTVLETNEVPYGELPKYGGTVPEYEDTTQYSYTFVGWEPKIVHVTGDAVYKAVFSTETNSYTVRWLNYDGTVLRTDYDVPYGTVPTYEGAEPEGPYSEMYDYTFSGWDREITAVVGDASYTAQYDSMRTGYQIFVDNYTRNKAVTSLVSGKYYKNTVTFTVSANLASVVAIKNPDESYTRLYGTKIDDTTYAFTVDITDSDVYVTIALKGDTTLDGKVNSKDAQFILRVSAKYETMNKLEELVGDVDVNGRIRSKDAQYASRVAARYETYAWDTKA